MAVLAVEHDQAHSILCRLEMLFLLLFSIILHRVVSALANIRYRYLYNVYIFYLYGRKPQGLVSKRKGVIQKDTNLLCMLAEATANRSSPGYLLDNILRKHFATLTERFLVPLNRYFATLVPNDM